MGNYNKKNSFQQFKEKINENRKAINAIAFIKFQAEFINVMNGRTLKNVPDEPFNRALNGFAHLRLTRIKNYKTDETGKVIKEYKRPVNQYIHTYVYYTSSTYIDKTTGLSDKMERNLNDVVFNVRREVVDNDAHVKTSKTDYGTNQMYFFIDAGKGMFVMSKEEVRANIIDIKIYNGCEVYVVRTQGKFYNKEEAIRDHEWAVGNNGCEKWDARYISNTTYSEYRYRGYLYRIEVNVNGKSDVKYFKSSKAGKDFLESVGSKYSEEYIRKKSVEGGTIKCKNGKLYKVSRVNQKEYEEESAKFTSINGEEKREEQQRAVQSQLGLRFKYSYFEKRKNKIYNKKKYLTTDISQLIDLSEYLNISSNKVGKITGESPKGLQKPNISEDFNLLNFKF